MEYKRKHDRRRPRGWFSLFIRLGGWSCLIFGAVLIVLTLFSAGLLFIADGLDREGKFTRAVVKERREVLAGDGTGSYLITFRYKTSEGGRTAEVEVDAGYYEEAVPESERVIRYLRDDPGVIETDIGTYRRSGGAVRNTGLLVGLVGLALLWLFGRRANMAVRARRDGEKRFGEVTGINPTGAEINGRKQGRLEWREADGQTGASLMRDMAELGRLYQAGDKIVVFRLGKHAFWEGDVGPPMREVE